MDGVERVVKDALGGSSDGRIDRAVSPAALAKNACTKFEMTAGLLECGSEVSRLAL